MCVCVFVFVCICVCVCLCVHTALYVSFLMANNIALCY